MIYTSYYKNLKNLKLSGSIDEFILIVRYMPSDTDISCLEELSPTPELLYKYKKGKISWSHFKTLMKDRIMIQNDILNYIIEQGKKKNICLLCFEENDKYCHRSIVREVIEEKGGEIREWEI